MRDYGLCVFARDYHLRVFLRCYVARTGVRLSFYAHECVSTLLHAFMIDYITAHFYV